MSSDIAERDIWEVANQLGGYVDPSTEKNLARFLIREAEEAAKLAERIVALQAELAKAREALTRVTLERVSELIDWLDEHEENASLLLAALTQKQLEEARAALQQKEREA
jgi:ABC-type nitrate/sulfonate/bicarbonate transport system substrate-binding protein